LNFGAVVQKGGVNANAIEVGSVQRAKVPHLKRSAVAMKLGVTTRNSYVV
jgi:hypothetical protein